MHNNQKLDSKQIIARFKEAVLTLKKLPSVRVRGYLNAWPDIVYSEVEIRRMDKKTKTWQVTPEAVSRMEEVLRWWALIEETEDKKLVWMRAEETPWDEICKVFGICRSAANKKYKKAIDKIYYVIS
jgi:hypothetical protein